MKIRFDQDFEALLKYFKKKGYALSPKSWRDVWEAAHARSFTVARVTAMDVLEDIRGELEKAIAAGTGLEDFKKNIRPTLERKGWLAPEGEAPLIELPDGTTRKRLNGWRLNTIYRTNMGTAYNTGRYRQQIASGRKFLQYKITPKPNNRPDHKTHENDVYPIDHPFWAKWYPPNGFGCGCYAKSLSARQVEARNLTVKDEMPDDEPDEGWAYNPGQAGLDAYEPDLAKYSDEARALLKKELGK